MNGDYMSLILYEYIVYSTGSWSTGIHTDKDESSAAISCETQVEMLILKIKCILNVN